MVDKLPAPIELTDSELDHVAAGQGQVSQIGFAAGNLVNVQNVSVLDNSLNNVDIAVNANVLGNQTVLQRL